MNLRSICASSVAVFALAACNAGSVLPTPNSAGASATGIPVTGASPSTVTGTTSPGTSATPTSATTASASPSTSASGTPTATPSGAATATASPSGAASATASPSGAATATASPSSAATPTASPLGAAPTVSPTSAATPATLNVSGTQTINGQLLQGIPLADGSVLSVALPILGNSPSFQYTGYTNASGLPSGLVLPSAGTFVGGITASSPSAFTIPSSASVSINLVKAPGLGNITYTAYYLSSTAPVLLYSQQQGSGSFVAPASVTLIPNQSYTLAIYSSSGS